MVVLEERGVGSVRLTALRPRPLRRIHDRFRFYFVLFCFILFYFVLFCFVLFCFVLFFLIVQKKKNIDHLE